MRALEEGKLQQDDSAKAVSFGRATYSFALAAYDEDSVNQVVRSPVPTKDWRYVLLGFFASYVAYLLHVQRPELWTDGSPYLYYLDPCKSDPWVKLKSRIDKYDAETCKGWTDDLDTMLVFVRSNCNTNFQGANMPIFEYRQDFSPLSSLHSASNPLPTSPKIQQTPQMHY